MNNVGQTIGNRDPVERQPETQLTRAENLVRHRQMSREELDQWIAELAALRKECQTGKTGLTVEQILEEIRADRDI